MIQEFHDLIESYFNRSPLPIYSDIEPDDEEIVFTVDRLIADDKIAIIEFIIRDGKIMILSAVQEKNTGDDLFFGKN